MEPRSAPVAELIGAIENWDPVRLAAILPSPDVQEFVRRRIDAFEGTVHYRILSRTVAMAKHDHAQWAVPGHLACANLLRAHGAPIEDMAGSPAPLVKAFLSPTAIWYPSTHHEAIAEVLRAYIDSGLLDAHAPDSDGRRPLQLAIRLGNPVAIQVLFDAGADIGTALERTAFVDVFDFVRQMKVPNEAAVTAALASHLMSERVAEHRTSAPGSKRRTLGV